MHRLRIGRAEHVEKSEHRQGSRGKRFLVHGPSCFISMRRTSQGTHPFRPSSPLSYPKARRGAEAGPEKQNPQSGKHPEDCTLIYFILNFLRGKRPHPNETRTDPRAGLLAPGSSYSPAFPNQRSVAMVAFIPGYSGGTAPDSDLCRSSRDSLLRLLAPEVFLLYHRTVPWSIVFLKIVRSLRFPDTVKSEPLSAT